ncbi:MAG: hypothetical protein MUE53_01760 [Chitinophagales bacterium]|jgi:hypothetical protein|nr:hypothetical protein [Chitinophagales bacterium]
MNNYPIRLEFKIFSLHNKINFFNSNGVVFLQSKQALFKLKENIKIFEPDTDNIKFEIQADRVIDFSAAYNFIDASGQVLGKIKRKGFASIWRATYVVFDKSDSPILEIKEKKPWVKVLDGILGEIPLIGMLLAMLINPGYLIMDNNGKEFGKILKKRSLFSKTFLLEKNPESLEILHIDEMLWLSTLMISTLERARG